MSVQTLLRRAASCRCAASRLKNGVGFIDIPDDMP
jgi:hypothetical protein